MKQNKLKTTMNFIRFLNFCIFDKLKGQLHGRAEIFNGLKITFRMKILRKKLYHANQRQKYYKLCFDNFSL